MLSQLTNTVVMAVQTRSPWTNVYGLARTLLALATGLTLLVNDTTILFHPASGYEAGVKCEGIGQYSLFCVVEPSALEMTRILAGLLLLVIATGIMPRVTALPHWWISWSVYSSVMPADGGDQMAATLSLMLLPIALTDPRRSHWGAPPATTSFRRQLLTVVAISTLIAIRIQMAVVYFQAGAAKMVVPEWVDGSAPYYWLLDPRLGVSGTLRPLLEPILATPLVGVIAWGTLLLEILLFAGLFLHKKYWPPLLIAGVFFHLLIGVCFGLISFGTIMLAALTLYLVPFWTPLTVPKRLMILSR